jgi:hypothetical protein
MQWVRTNRRFGAWCALVAIALQIVLSFGHAHRFAGVRTVGVPQASIAIQTAVDKGDPASKPGSPAVEYCAICVAINMGASAVPPETPVWGTPVIAGGVRFVSRAEAAASTLAHLLFQARAPPSA